MDEATKALLEKIDNNITDLKEDLKEDIREVKADVRENNMKLNEMKLNYVTKNDCKESHNKIEARENNLRNLTYKKITLMIGGISGVIYGAIELVKQLKG